MVPQLPAAQAELTDRELSTVNTPANLNYELVIGGRAAFALT
jgi:hypothetical protein